MEFNGHPTAQRLMHAFRKLKRADWRKRFVAGHVPSEMMVLISIKRAMKNDSNGVMVSTISSMLHVTSPTVTQLIKGLEAKGLVERNIDKEDRRAVRITLTDAGETVTKQAFKEFSDSFNGLVEYLGEEQSKQLANLLDQVFQYFDERKKSWEQSQSKGDEA
ncbi:MarR family winged helix-turn-helix transcriptional regulator [Brevibacillus sp. B_LB10_24]|uniref:MarR family winged helix-turn-helix transcriptional regulator n=1 Tax=Brevibacillus sp. B_LB10_24 TaxID=3380645 RepID=UPI0038B9CD75